MAEQRTLPKRQLSVNHYELDVPYKQGTKFLDRLQVVDNSLPEDSPLAGKPLRMTIFSDTLKAFARGKDHFVADVQERDRPESEYGPDRTIVQIYDEKGEPVQTKQRGGGGGNYRRSLDDDLALEAVKRRSIEGQSGVDKVITILTSPTDIFPEDMVIDKETWDRIVGKTFNIIELWLDNYLDAAQATPTKAPDKPPGKRQRADKPKPVSETAEPDEDPIKHFGDLLTRASKLDPPVTRKEVLEIAGKTEGDSVADVDLESVWDQVQFVSEAKKNDQEEKKAEQLPFE